jgi:hypothetical protein
MAWKSTFILVLFAIPLIGAAQTDRSEDSQCEFVSQQAAAERDLLRTPSVVSGFSESESGLPTQAVVGLSQTLANEKKAVLTMRAAARNCELYSATTEAQKKITFAQPSIQKDVLRHRLALVEKAEARIDALISESKARLAAQNMTRPGIFVLMSAKVRLEATRTAVLTAISIPSVPNLSDKPIRELVTEKQTADLENQHALAQLEKQNNWDVGLTVGFHQQVGTTNVPDTSVRGPYGSISATYNLGSRAVNRHLDKSVVAYGKWQTNQFGDVSNQAELLKRSLNDILAIQEPQLQVLDQQMKSLDTELQAIEGVDTDSALLYSNQVTAEKLLLQVDIDDLHFSIVEIRQFIADNF